MPDYEDVGATVRLKETAVLAVPIHAFPGPRGVFSALGDVFPAIGAIQRIFGDIFDQSATHSAFTGCHSDLLFCLGAYYAGICAPLRECGCTWFVQILVGRNGYHGGLHTQPTFCIRPGNRLFVEGNLSYTVTGSLDSLCTIV